MYNSIYPVQIKPYVPPQTKKQVGSKDEEQESSQSSDLNREGHSNPNATSPYSSVNPDGKSAYARQEFPNGKKSTIDYSKSKVNIAQILTDFKNTALAIGSPPNIIQEVDQYLGMAETESLKNEPDKKLIQSNLKNASNVLDKFISVTLNKKSKVVENWIDALFLQQVNYKSDPTTVNEDFLVKLPDKETGDMKPISQNLVQKPETQEEIPAQTPVIQTEEPVQKASNGVYIPENENIRKAFIQGKKFAAINEPQKALNAFKTALEEAISTGDTNAEGMVCFEMGQIYDKNDNLEDALKYYHQAHKASNDNNLKVKALYSMASIYNDVVYFEPAMEHYFAAISYAGETENLNAQTKALSDIADMYAERYDIPNTYEYYGMAKNIALETQNNKVMGAIWSRSGDSLALLNENVNALQDYKASTQFYEQTDSAMKMAKNYEKASEVMLKLGNRTKAKSLLEKAQKLAVNADNEQYAQQLNKHLSVF